MKDKVIAFLILSLGVVGVFGDGHKDNPVNSNNDVVTGQDRPASTRQSRAQRAALLGFVSCALAYDAVCFVNTADDYLKEEKSSLLAEADSIALTTTGRADEDSSPSQLTSAISKLISELTDMFKEGISGLFRTAKEDDDDDDDDSDNTKAPATENGEKKSRKISETPRKKKKKEKLKALIKLLVIGAVLKAKITLLLKILAAHLQLKFFLVALAGLILNVIRFYLDLKKEHHPQKVVYYEHAQHQHHYEGGDEDWSSSPGSSHGYWGRSYEEGENGAQDLAYAKQKPEWYNKVETKPSSSWSWLG